MFVESNLEEIIRYLDKLEANTKPTWGSMSAQRMVEHITDTFRIALGQNPQTLIVPEEKLPGMLRFLDSDKEMMQNVTVPFAKKETPLRNSELELAVDELVEEFLNYEEYFETNPNKTELHPFYGNLNFEQWQKLNSKHLTHHFKQFGLM